VLAPDVSQQIHKVKKSASLAHVGMGQQADTSLCSVRKFEKVAMAGQTVRVALLPL